MSGMLNLLSNILNIKADRPYDVSYGQSALLIFQLKDCLNANGESLVFVLNNRLNDCGNSKPN